MSFHNDLRVVDHLNVLFDRNFSLLQLINRSILMKWLINRLFGAFSLKKWFFIFSFESFVSLRLRRLLWFEIICVNSFLNNCCLLFFVVESNVVWQRLLINIIKERCWKVLWSFWEIDWLFKFRLFVQKL